MPFKIRIVDFLFFEILELMVCITFNNQVNKRSHNQEASTKTA